MGDEGDATDDAEAAMREHENLDDNRSDVASLAARRARAHAGGGRRRRRRGAGAPYDEAAAGLRLDGTLPAGLFGVAIRERHLALLRCWREGLRVALKGDLPAGLAPIWLGAAPEHRRDVDLRAAVPLSVPLAAGATAMALHGCTEPIAMRLASERRSR